MDNNKRLGLMFDCLRAPYDFAHIIQIATAINNCDVYLSGNCIDSRNIKITSKVGSWGIQSPLKAQHLGSFEEAVAKLKAQGAYLIGTSPNTRRDFYDVSLDKIQRPVFVFGTESSGLSKYKVGLLDELVCLPMHPNCKFLTLPVVVSSMAYEFYRQNRRQFNGGNNNEVS